MSDRLSHSPEEAAHQITLKLLALPLISGILQRVEAELNPRFVFHNRAHAEDVLSEAVLFASIDGRSTRELELLAVAAAYHDAGFLEGYEDHEARGAELATAAMAEAGGYSDEEIALVRSMIHDTRLTDAGGDLQLASTPLAAYLLDADLSNLGRGDFFDRCDALCKEHDNDLPKHYRQTFSLMQQHRYLTPAARKLRGKKKQKNLEQLRRKLKQAGAA